MKYFGEKSLSSLISTILAIAWPLILIMAIVGSGFFSAALFSEKAGTFIETEIAKDHGAESKDMKDWQEFKKAPLAAKMLIFPYGAVIIVLLLNIISRSKTVFDNFRKEVIFNNSNVDVMSGINKLLIWFSILTFNVSGLFTCLMFAMLIQIFRSGTKLQEEHDLTV